MIRHTPEGLKDIPLPLKKILEAKIADIELQSDDISSKAKGIAGSTVSTILTSALSLAIYRL